MERSAAGLRSVGSVGTQQRAHYSPPWADLSIIGIAGSSGSGKTSLALELVKSLNLPWVIIMSMVRIEQLVDGFSQLTMPEDSFYKSLTPEQNQLAHANEYDLDSPQSLDFDLLVECLESLKLGSATIVTPRELAR